MNVTFCGGVATLHGPTEGGNKNDGCVIHCLALWCLGPAGTWTHSKFRHVATWDLPSWKILVISPRDMYTSPMCPMGWVTFGFMLASKKHLRQTAAKSVGLSSIRDRHLERDLWLVFLDLLWEGLFLLGVSLVVDWCFSFQDSKLYLLDLPSNSRMLARGKLRFRFGSPNFMSSWWWRVSILGGGVNPT